MQDGCTREQALLGLRMLKSVTDQIKACKELDMVKILSSMVWPSAISDSIRRTIYDDKGNASGNG